jgi:hypothetical protein
MNSSFLMVLIFRPHPSDLHWKVPTHLFDRESFEENENVTQVTQTE